MKKAKRSIIVIVPIVLILIIFLFQIKKSKNNLFQDELIFFKLFSSEHEINQNTFQSNKQQNQEYEFKVSYKNIDFKKIDLVDTINPNTLIHEKIAPRNRRKI